MKVFVDFSASFDRVPHPDSNLEDSISEVGNIITSYVLLIVILQSYLDLRPHHCHCSLIPSF